MLLIPCPNCGERDESEFDYGGRAINYPELEAPAGDWHRALHLRDNQPDDIEELWYHAGGCECWIRLTRNLLNHEIKPDHSETGERPS
jgi:heterotetrameric sarcosine oxidase delta subunit